MGTLRIFTPVRAGSTRGLVDAAKESGGRCGRHRPRGGKAEAEQELLVFPVELHDLEDPGPGALEGLAERGPRRVFPRGGAQRGEGDVEPLQQAPPTVEQFAAGRALVLPEELVFLEGERVEFIAQVLVLEQGFHGIRGWGPARPGWRAFPGRGRW